MKSRFWQNKGVISVYVLLLAGLYTSMGLTLLAIQMGALNDSMNIQDEMQARYLAQTALQEAHYYVAHIDSSWTGTSTEQTLQVGTKTMGTYQYQISKVGNTYNVTATGYVPNSTSPKKYSFTQTYQFWIPNPEIIFEDGFESGNLSLWTEDNDTGADWDVDTTFPKNGTYSARGRKTSGSGTKIAKLLTPIFDLAGYHSVVLRFVWQAHTNGIRFCVYQNSGSGWNQIYNDSSNTYNSTYTRPAIRLTISNLTSTVQFRFESYTSSTSGQAHLLDDVQLSAPAAYYDSRVD